MCQKIRVSQLPENKEAHKVYYSEHRQILYVTCDAQARKKHKEEKDTYIKQDELCGS